LTLLQKYNVVGLGLRGLSILGKFFLITYLTAQLTFTDLGIYGLFLTSIVLVNYVQGFEFHTYMARQILGNSPEDRANLLFNQALFHLILYTLVLPTILIIFLFEFLPWSLIIYFYWIAIAVHIAQEIHRLLIVISKPTLAYLILFFSHGLWTIGYILIAWQNPNWRNLDMLFLSWGISATLGVIVGAVALYNLGLLTLEKKTVRWDWINTGILVSYKFFIGIIAYRVIDLSDRYFVQYFEGEEMVGVYTLFGSVTNIAHELVFTGIVALIFPLMIRSIQQQDMVSYQKHMSRLKRDVLISSAGIAVLMVIGIYVLIYFLQRPELALNMPTFFLLLGSVTILNLSTIPHYQLYAYGLDHLIMRSVILGVFLNLILNTLLIPPFGIIGAASATIISFGVVGIAKMLFAQLHASGPLS